MSFARIVAGAFAAGLMAAAPVLASDAEQRFAVRGIGSSTCTEFAAKVDSNAPDLVAYIAWADGALSAANRYRENVFEVAPFLDPPGVFANIVLNLCRANPQALFDTAVTQTIEVLRPVWVSTGQEMVTVAAGDASVRIYPETLKAVQTKLIAGGFLEGEADGAFGAMTQAALTAFQSSVGRPQTGLPDADTVIALLLAN